MTNKFKLIGRFYRSALLGFGLTVSLVLASVVYLTDGGAAMPAGWLKLFLYLPALYFIAVYKQKELYYYYNLGLRKNILFAACCAADYLIYWLLIICLLWMK